MKGIARSLLIAAALPLAALMVSPAGMQAQVLIINGSTGTSEPATTSSITTNLTNLFNGIGVSPTVVSDVPSSLAGFSQVWDIRFSNNFPLTGTDQSLFLSFLQAGGGMFVMGENANFTTRNNSVLSLISAAGGGSLSFTVPGQTQTVLAPFTGPNPVTSVTYAASGGVSSHGTGQYITEDGAGNGSGVAFAKGTLVNAPAGALTTIFDVNFMQTSASTESQNLTKNLVGFVNVQVPVTTTPEPASLLLFATGAAGAAALRRRRRKSA